MFAFTGLFYTREKGEENMTIKEIEEASGMQRANIRYYEAEGFLHPEREKNGYRNYTDADLDILKKIKLLRSLHISLEEIKAMHQGEQELGKTLAEHISYLTKQQRELEKSKYVCEKMQRDGATYEKLNTEQYLLVLKKCLPNVTEQEEWVERDTVEPVQAPFLRIFARLFDYLLYAVLWMVVVFLWHKLFGVTAKGMVSCMIISPVAALALALLLEPVFLRWLDATPGKMILGLRVVNDLGGPISKEKAWSRTWRVVFGVHDWQYRDLFQTIRIFQAMENGKPLDWEYESNTTLELKDDSLWRRIVLVVALILCILVTLLMFRGAQLPPNRGGVTAAEFAENYNARLKYYDAYGDYITETGEWAGVKKYSTAQNFTRTYDGKSYTFKQSGTPKQVEIITENGVVTEVGFFYETRDSREDIDLYTYLMTNLALTFLDTQESSVLKYKQWKSMQKQVENAMPMAYYRNVYKDFSCRVGDLQLTCDVELQGYKLWGNSYVAIDGADTYYCVRFSVKKMKQ